MKVLVTGNLGYIGPVVVEALAGGGHEIHGYDSALSARYTTGPLPRVARQTVGDLRDSAALDRAIDPCDAVVHLAAISNDPLGELDTALTRAVNGDATLRLFDLARGRRIVLFSSASVYGAAEASCAEDAPVRPLTLYSELKLLAEHAALAQPYALVLRNGTVHGPAPVIRTDLLLNAMVASAVANSEVVLMTAPATKRPVIDVRDLGSLLAGLLERGVTGLYNVAGMNVSVGAAAGIVSGITGSRVVARYDSADPRDYAMDVGRLARVAPWWTPRALDASVRDLVAHYRAIGLTTGDVRSRRYHRLAQYQDRVPATVAST